MNKESNKAHNDILLYTLEHAKNNPYFIHQHAVDAYAVQHSNKDTKRIIVAFALIGLYLFLEKGYSGKQVQNAHVKLARLRNDWPEFSLAENRGDITVFDVLEKTSGIERDKKIRKWCESAWKAHEYLHQRIRDIIDPLS